jgi:TetR/AcrR family tetracycline transcriptional repressor
MALYWHVENKDELLDAMGDRIFAAGAFPIDATLPWYEQLHAVVTGLVETFRAYPACLDLAYRRILACPDGLYVTEQTLGALRGAGFTHRQTVEIAVHALNTAIMLVRSEPGAEAETGTAEAAGVLAEKRAKLNLLPADEYPNIRELGAELLQCEDEEGYYNYGIDLFVAGVRAMLGHREPRDRELRDRELAASE